MDDIKIPLPNGKTVVGKDGQDKTEISITEPTGKQFLKYGSVLKSAPMLNDDGEVVTREVSIFDNDGNDTGNTRSEVVTTNEVNHKVVRQYLMDCADVPINQIETLPAGVVYACSGALIAFLVPQDSNEENSPQ